mgnify:CR=1 FL=1|tara:strand:+ start:34 stop:549 length:516 start_codon:yes stop_codon:yes gene_type:complete
MQGILKTFTDIMLFKKGPQDLPSSKSLLNVFIAANILISFIPNDVNYNLVIAVVTSIIYVGASLLFIQTTLNIKDNMSNTDKYKLRYVQSATTILGIHAIIGFITSVIFFLSGNTDSIIFIILIVTIYSWLVYGYVFKETLDCTTFLGLSISFLYSMVIGFMLIIVLSVLI